VKSFVQKLVTNSSTEAELLALVDGVKKSFPILKLLEEITETPVVINAYQDNKSTILLAKGGEGLSGKSKHFRVRYHFLKELIDEGKLKLTYVPTDDMVADVLTKPMGGENFRLLRSAIMGKIPINNMQANAIVITLSPLYFFRFTFSYQCGFHYHSLSSEYCCDGAKLIKRT
jgi:hypothetical protein